MQDGKSDAGKQMPSLGTNLRRLRSLREWNLSRLAKETGLPQSTLSKVEHGKMSLNFEKLVLIANVLEADVSELFVSSERIAKRSQPTARRTIHRSTDTNPTVHENYEFAYLCTELKDRLMVPILLKVGDRAQSPDGTYDEAIELTHVVGERFAYVLSGEVEFISDQYETTLLKAGDSLYIDAAMPHAFVAPDGKQGEILAVVASDDREYLDFVRRAAVEGRADATADYELYRSNGI